LFKPENEKCVFAFSKATHRRHDLTRLTKAALRLAAVIAHAFTVLVLKRSILTEKVARRGFHLRREYSVDPLEVIFVREVMRTRLIAFEGTGTIAEARSMVKDGHSARGQHLYPVIEADRRLSGVITRKDLASDLGELTRMSELARPKPIMAFADEPLSTVLYRMAETGYTRMPVVDNNEERMIVGMISLDDLLHARARNLSGERTRERVLQIRLPFRSARSSSPATK
jgi:CIC family chloride channel protein